MTDAPGRSPSSVDDVLSEYGGLEAQLPDPALHEDPAAARGAEAHRLGQLGGAGRAQHAGGAAAVEQPPVGEMRLEVGRQVDRGADDLGAGRVWADDDASFADEA